MYDSRNVLAMMKATIQKDFFRELPFGARQYKGTGHSTFGAAGDESEGDDLYIVTRDIMVSMINWVVPRIIMIFRPICFYAYGVIFVQFAAQGSLPYIKEDFRNGKSFQFFSRSRYDAPART